MKTQFIFLGAIVVLPLSAMAQVPIQTLRPCLDIEDQSKERLDCYDKLIAPTPKKVTARAKTVSDCRFLREEDERLACFNGFVSAAPVSDKPKKRSKKH